MTKKIYQNFKLIKNQFTQCTGFKLGCKVSERRLKCNIQHWNIITLRTSGFFLNIFIGVSIRLNSCLAHAIRPAIGGKFRGAEGLLLSVWYMCRTCSRSCPYDVRILLYLDAISNWQPRMLSNLTKRSRDCSVCLIA